MGAATAKIVQSLGGEVFGVDYREPDYELAGFTNCDLRNKSEIDAALASLSEPIDRVFYCAGLPQTHPPLDVMKVNFAAMRHVVEGVQPLVPNGGAIAIISSNAGLQFMDHMAPISELLATEGFDGANAWCESHQDVVADGYTFSKEAIIVYTMQRALEVVGDGVRVNCISPGPTATPMMPEFEKAAGPELIRVLGPHEPAGAARGDGMAARVPQQRRGQLHHRAQPPRRRGIRRGRDDRRDRPGRAVRGGHGGDGRAPELSEQFDSIAKCRHHVMTPPDGTPGKATVRVDEIIKFAPDRSDDGTKTGGTTPMARKRVIKLLVALAACALVSTAFATGAGAAASPYPKTGACDKSKTPVELGIETVFESRC